MVQKSWGNLSRNTKRKVLRIVGQSEVRLRWRGYFGGWGLSFHRCEEKWRVGSRTQREPWRKEVGLGYKEHLEEWGGRSDVQTNPLETMYKKDTMESLVNWRHSVKRWKPFTPRVIDVVQVSSVGLSIFILRHTCVYCVRDRFSYVRVHLLRVFYEHPTDIVVLL